MPSLIHAKRINALAVDESPGRPISFEPLAHYLRLHGLTMRPHRIPGRDGPAGQVLLDHARSKRSDLLVMGGYGHSRLREFVFGGTPRYVLQHADLPVLLSH